MSERVSEWSAFCKNYFWCRWECSSFQKFTDRLKLEELPNPLPLPPSFLGNSATLLLWRIFLFFPSVLDLSGEGLLNRAGDFVYYYIWTGSSRMVFIEELLLVLFILGAVPSLFEWLKLMLFWFFESWLLDVRCWFEWSESVEKIELFLLYEAELISFLSKGILGGMKLDWDDEDDFIVSFWSRFRDDWSGLDNDYWLSSFFEFWWMAFEATRLFSLKVLFLMDSRNLYVDMFDAPIASGSIGEKMLFLAN